MTVLNVGAAAIPVDEGRPGWAHLAVTTSGAFDRPAYRLANRLVGNRPGAVAVEFVLGPMTMRFSTHATLAVTGIDADLTLQQPGRHAQSVSTHSTLMVPAGSVLRIGMARSGLRGYLAIRGGWKVDRVLGSGSHDTLADLGPPPLRAGDQLPVGSDFDDFPAVDHAPRPSTVNDLDLTLLPAHRAGVMGTARDTLAELAWTVSPASNRIGVRLAGPSLVAARQRASEPLVRGAVQLPPNGQPVIMGPDHPTTGGYPVIGVIADVDTDRLAQARPGSRVRLIPVPDPRA